MKSATTYTKVAGKVVALDSQAKIDGAKIAYDGTSQFPTWQTADCSGPAVYVSTYIKGDPSAEAYKAYGNMTRTAKLGQGLDFAGF